MIAAPSAARPVKISPLARAISSTLAKPARCASAALVMSAIVGRAIYTGDVRLPEAIEAVARVSKAGA